MSLRMSICNWLFALKHRTCAPGNSRPRRNQWRSHLINQFIELEDRSLPSAFVPTLPAQGTMQSQNLNAVIYTPQTDTSISPANLPEDKLVTIMNNSSNVMFPIFYSANSTTDDTSGAVVRLVLNTAGAGYNGKYQVNITGGSGSGATAKVNANGNLFGLELVNGGAGYKPTDQLQVTFTPLAGASTPTTVATATVFVSQVTQNGVSALYDKKDNLNKTYRGYVGEVDPVTGQYGLGLQPGHQVTVMLPPAFWDGGRLYLASNGSEPLSSVNDPGYPLQPSSEWTYNPTL